MTKLGVLKGHQRRPGTKALPETSWEAFYSAVQKDSMGHARGRTEGLQHSLVAYSGHLVGNAMSWGLGRQRDRQKLLRHNTREE